ncbi:hypothetical protein PoMZ_03346 [Pyricularia oryzae]|uniref:Uncharacterized protein n=1 Tax=Pyricularia oryzae TaxID=318829 RepID=A0A4P7NCS0_PYROR|nr:hypothetical protein PoMZ_03346 [Pyricularia oryzae]
MAGGNVFCAVEKVLNDGADVNIQGGKYGNAFQAVLFKGHKKIVQILVDKGADGGRYGNAFQTVLLGGHQEILQIFVDNGALLTGKVNKTRKTEII